MDGMGMGITNSVHKKYRLNLNTLVFHGPYWQRKFNGIFWTHRIFHIEAGAPRCQVVDLLSEGTRSFNQQKLGVQIEPTKPTCNK